MRERRIQYRNLAAEMARKALSIKAIAKEIGISAASMSLKLSGKFTFSIDEAFRIRDKVFPILTVDYLFDPRPRYDDIDVFNFPPLKQKPKNEDTGPDDCA